MVFNFREAVGGLKHLRLRWSRMRSKHSDSFFMKDYEARGILVERYSELDGRPCACPICGYAMIRLTMANGWLLETCSAMPIIKGMETKEFATWANSLVTERQAAQI